LSEARLQLFQSDKMASLGRLAAGVAHEINNPLTGILTYSSYLLKRTQNDKDMQNDLSIIVRETMRSRDIVKGLLDFARQSVPKKRNTDINQIIEQALSIAENELLLHKITVIRTLDPKLPSLTVDANQIQQVFLNLIVNADHAMMEKGGELTVSTAMINLLPQGVALIRTACCPKGHDLMDQSNRIDGFSSIKLLAKQKDREGLVYIDPGYGRHNHNYGMELSVSDEFDLACPKCKVSLLDKDSECPKCHSKIYRFDVPPKGPFVGCSNKNCDWQVWDEVEKEGAKEYLEAKVIDQGYGISKENLGKIFDPFFTTKGQKGTGLGLAVIWGIIDNHDGTISVESQPGRGTTFTIRLPGPGNSKGFV